MLKIPFMKLFSILGEINLWTWEDPGKPSRHSQTEAVWGRRPVFNWDHRAVLENKFILLTLAVVPHRKHTRNCVLESCCIFYGTVQEFAHVLMWIYISELFPAELIVKYNAEIVHKWTFSLLPYKVDFPQPWMLHTLTLLTFFLNAILFSFMFPSLSFLSFVYVHTKVWHLWISFGPLQF